MDRVAICICTRQRPDGIINLLKSLELLQIPDNTEIKIIVVENDHKDFTKNLIIEFSANSKHDIQYYLETERGISTARNRSVKEAENVDFCCFVDDDQSVEPDWLIELLKCQKEFDADGVWGQNPPVFHSKVPHYIELFHQPDIYKYGEVVYKAYTNCLLLKKAWLDKFEGPFDVRLNFSGGEDTFLTSSISEKGGVIRFTPYAKANEIVPLSRSTVRYILRRTFRMSNTRFYVLSLLNKNFSKYSILPRLIMRFCNGVLLTFPFLFTKSDKLKGLIKIADAFGGFVFVFGRKNKFYR